MIRSRSYGLKAKEGTAEGVRRIALGRAEKALEELAGAEGEGFADAIHSARKDLKKLRSLLRLIRDELGEDAFRAENRRYRDAGRLLAESRDAEVKLETLASLEQRFGEELPTEAARGWKGELERERARLGERSQSQMAEAIECARKEIEAGREEISGWQLEGNSWKAIGTGLTRSYKRGRREMRRTLADPSAENVHEWRKRAKDMWYQLRIVRKAWPALIGETADRAHELADLLGEHHDLAVLGEDLADREGVDRHERFAGLIERRQEELLAQALDLGRRFYAEKPKAFSRRFRSYWKAWREEL